MILALLACNASGLALRVADDPGTVVSATWSDPGARSRVVVEDDDGPWLASEWQESGADDHAATLLGLFADRDYSVRVETDGGPQFESLPVHTRALPSDFPGFETTGTPGWEGYFTTSFLGDTNTVVILEEHGRVVWYRTVDEAGRVLRARLRADGLGVRYATSMMTDPEQQPSLEACTWEGGVTSRLEVPYFSHDFLEHADGTLALLLFDLRSAPGFLHDVWGNSIVELPAEGAARTVWSTWDIWDPNQHGRVEDDGTWTHGNAVDYDEESAHYTVGFRGMNAIIEVDGPTGETLRQIGGPTSDYSFASKQDEVYAQHQFEWLDPSRIFVFDNRGEKEGSRAVELALDESTATASAEWEYEHDPVLWSYAMGDVDRDEDGGSLITWASAGVISDVGPEGHLRWELSTELGIGIGFTERVAALPGMTRLR